MNACAPITGTLLILAACATLAQAPSRSAAPGLGGTSWQLVKFQGSDDKTLTDRLVGISEPKKARMA